MSGLSTHDHRTLILADARDRDAAGCVAEDKAKMERATRPCALREMEHVGASRSGYRQ